MHKNEIVKFHEVWKNMKFVIIINSCKICYLTVSCGSIFSIDTIIPAIFFFYNSYDKKQAEYLFRRTLQIREKCLGKDHLLVATTLYHLGFLKYI